MNKKTLKKGFTITEILATLVILGIILVIAIPSVYKLQEKFKEDYYKELESTVLASAKTYFKDNAELRPLNILEASIVKYKDLIDNKYIDKIEGYSSSDSITGKVVLVKLKDDYFYKNCYEINEKKQYDDIDYLESNEVNHEDNICYFENEEPNKDRITTNYFLPNGNELVDDNKKIYLHVNDYSNDELRTLLGATKKVVRENIEGVLYSVDLNDMIYPNNISALGINKLSTDKEIQVTYKKSSSEFIKKQISMFIHPSPLVNNSSDSEFFIKKTDQIIVSMPATPYTFSTEYNSSWKRYEYFIDGETSWKTLEGCENLTCSVNPDLFAGKVVKFRTIGETIIDGIVLGSEQIGKESIGYNIKIKTVTVTLNPNGGSVSPSKLTDLEPGANYPELPTPQRENYEFLGWKYGSEIITTEDIILDADHTLEASWKDLSYTYKITYHANGGTGTMTPTTCNSTSDCDLKPNTFTRKGYNFIGWAYSATGHKQHDNKDKVNFVSDKTLYALWEAKTVKVTLNTNGGTLEGNNEFYFTYNDYYGDLPEPEREGYTFTGWYTKSTDGSIIWKFTKVPASDHILYAHWTKNKIKLQVSMSDGILNSSSSLYSSSGGYVYKKETILSLKSKTIETYDYGANINLPNYNESNKINIVKDGQSAVSGAEWKLADGTTFDQNKKINSSSLCDATKTDCTATIYVNWQPKPDLYLVMTDSSKDGKFYSEYVSGTTVYPEDLKNEYIYFNAFVKHNGNTIDKIEYNLNSKEWKEFTTYEECKDRQYRVCYNQNSSDYKRGWTYFNAKGTYKYKVKVTYNGGYILEDDIEITIGEKPSVGLVLYATDATKESGKYKPYNSSWTKNSIYFNAFITNNGNTIKSIKYSIDNGISWSNFSKTNVGCDSGYSLCGEITVNRRDLETFTLTLNTKVRVRVVDQDDRVVEKSMLIKIDKINPSSPIINLSSTTETSNNVTFTITNGIDIDSGVSKSQYSYDNIDWYNYSSKVTLLSTTGVKKVYARTVDKVGNVSNSVTTTGKCDKDLVSVVRHSNGKDNGKCWFKLNLSQYYSGLSGINGYDYLYWNIEKTNDTENNSEDNSACLLSNEDLEKGNVPNLVASGKGVSSIIKLPQKYSRQYNCFAVRPHRTLEISGLNRWTIQRKHAITSNSCS